jgi:2-dehydro-3-deoxygluconokinase
VGLACLGVPGEWVSALPDTGPGRLIARQAQANGVSVANIAWVEEDRGRTGLYFLEEGVDPRPSAVTYDRKDTAMSRVTEGTFDWDTILDGATAFHISGITLALSPGARAESMAAVACWCRST